jgi:TfoX/Sxy family transcriptional regulator of competence genes
VAYDEVLLNELRTALQDLELRSGEALAERKMFGGVCITLNGKMVAGVTGSRLMVRAELEDLAAGEDRGVASAMDFTGRPMKGFAYVHPEKLEPGEWSAWLEASADYVRRHMLGK